MQDKDEIKKKNKVGWIIVIVVISVIVLSVGLTANKIISKNSSVDKDDTMETYLVSGDESLNFKGKSTIVNEQNIISDKMKGDVKDIKVNDGDMVEEGQVLFTYYNDTIQTQIDQVNNSIKSTQRNIDNLEDDKNESQSELNSSKKKLEAIKNPMDPSYAALSSKVEALSQAISGYDNQIDSLKLTIESQNDQKESLKKDINTEVKAEIPGKVVLDTSKIGDMTAPFLRIISTSSRIKCSSSEFDINSINVDDEVMIRVISTGELIKGKITKIEDLPEPSMDPMKSSATLYSFYIKPEKDIRVGFSVNVMCNYKGIVIPDNCLYKKDSKDYVLKKTDSGHSETQVLIYSEGGENYLLDQNIVVGDKLFVNPSKVLEEEKK